MTEKSWPWNGLSPGDAAYAPYDAPTETASIYRAISGSEVTPNKGGVFSGTLNELSATTLGQVVTIQSGRALVDGTWYESNTTVQFTFSIPGSSTRLDRIVLRKDWTAQTVRLVQLTGSPSSGGGAVPALTQVAGTTWDIPLWEISITTSGVITLIDERLLLPIEDGVQLLLNNSGGSVVAGDVVVIDISLPDAFKTTTTAKDPDVYGVALETIANGAIGRIAVGKGNFVSINVSGTTAIGDWIATHTVAKQGAPSNTRVSNNYFARAIEARTGAGLVKCILLGGFGQLQFMLSSIDPGVGITNPSGVAIPRVVPTVFAPNASGVVTNNGGGFGPTTTTDIRAYLPVYINNVTYYIPLMV